MRVRLTDAGMEYCQLFDKQQKLHTMDPGIGTIVACGRSPYAGMVCAERFYNLKIENLLKYCSAMSNGTQEIVQTSTIHALYTIQETMDYIIWLLQKNLPGKLTPWKLAE